MILYETIFDDLLKKACKLNDRIDGKFFQSFANDRIMYSHISRVNEIPSRYYNRFDTLIVRDGDIPFSDELADRFLPLFKRIFCQNKTTTRQNVFTIPIGMESTDYIKEYDKFNVIQTARQNYNRCPKFLLYGNFSVATSIRKRFDCYCSFKEKPYFFNKITQILPHPTKLQYDHYLSFCNDILDSLFVLCPEGNGIDTHRFWETIYLGRVPVVLHNSVVDSFSDLPILVLDNWNEFENKFQQFINTYWNHEFTLKYLTKDYWRDIITNN